MKQLITFCCTAWLFMARQAFGQEIPPPVHGSPLQELQETYSTLDPGRMPTGVLLDQVIPLSRPERFAGQGDTAANWTGWEQQ